MYIVRDYLILETTSCDFSIFLRIRYRNSKHCLYTYYWGLETLRLQANEACSPAKVVATPWDLFRPIQFHVTKKLIYFILIKISYFSVELLHVSNGCGSRLLAQRVK
jgi:hypothetical protein